MQVQALGIAWYRAEDYDRLKAMFTDGAKLPDTFEDWQRAAETGLEKMAGGRVVVVKAYIDPNTFPEWCKAHGKEMNAKGRTFFASECAANRMRG